MMNAPRAIFSINQPAKLTNLNSHTLEVVSLYRDTQLQVGENYSYLFNLRLNICISVQKTESF